MLRTPLVVLRTGFLSMLLLLASATAAYAEHLMITRHFTGIWTAPDHESQGLVLQIADQLDDSKLAVAYWFTYGDDLLSSWFMAIGRVQGHGIEMTLYEASGVGFLEQDIEGDVNVVPIGSLHLAFHNCNQGVARFETPAELLGSGEFRIRRLAGVYRARCTGGLSDDMPPSDKTSKLDVFLHSVRDDVAARGSATFHINPAQLKFRVRAEGLRDGTYTLMVCGEPRGEMTVVGGEGELDYRSPPRDEHLHLDFDPRDCNIELQDAAGAVLSTGDAVLGDHGRGPPPSP